jgi:2-polyprenyl-6-methoxyphenol hydroxylase-like FAD-dependent oxidoreductase
MAHVEEVPVLIVGGSLVGLTTALLLGHCGVPSLSLERHAGTAIHPRAGHFHLRTLEILRQVGLDERVRAKSLEMYSATGGIISVESLAGREHAVYVAELNEGVEGYSPTVRVFINQDVLEPILRERALELGATLRNRVEVIALEQDGDGVTATVRDLENGEHSEVRARYVVAADGNRSPARERLGIPMEGYGELSRSITVYFNADCSELIRDRNQGVIYVHNPELRGFFRLDRSGGTGFLVINTVGEDVTRDEAIDVQSGLTEDRVRSFLRAAIGADVPMEVVDVANWSAEATCAERFQVGRVFLAGDAAHVVPPNGGYGGNTGVQDAHNIAWKLAAVVRGEAGPALLDTYEAERRPLAQLTVRQAYTRYSTRVVPERGSDGVDPFVPDIQLEIGTVVRSGAVIDDGSDDGRLHMDPSQTRGRPGTRAPHVSLPDGCSTLDLFGRGFVLLHGPQATPPDGVASHELDGPALDIFGLEPTGAALVRPDGIVAWRSRATLAPESVAQAIDTVLALV